MKNKVKMVAFDLDGTILTSDKKFTAYTKQVFEKIIAKGIEVLPATGRPLSGIPQEILQFPGIRYAITANGARIVDLQTKETIYEQLVSVENTRKILDIFEHYDTLREVYYNGVGYAETHMLKKALEYLPHQEMRDYVVSTRRQVENIRKFVEERQQSTDKVQAIFRTIDEREKAFEELNVYKDIEVTGAIDNIVEVNAKGVHKGNGLILLGQILDINIQEIMAFGDGANDIEMLRTVGFGICMANGMEAVKEVADYIALSNNEDGVAKFIEQSILV